MAIENSYNFRKFSDAITTSGVVGANRLLGLAAEKYAVVINLLPDSSEHAVANEKSIIESQGIKYVYIPVDWNNPTLDDYEQFVRAMDSSESMKVHVHCAANFRVSAFMSLYAESRHLMSPEEADAFVHDLWDPDSDENWERFMGDVRDDILDTE